MQGIPTQPSGEPTSAVGIKSVLHPQPKGRISHSNCECSSSNLLGIDARPPLGAKGRASRALPFGQVVGLHLWAGIPSLRAGILSLFGSQIGFLCPSLSKASGCLSSYPIVRNQDIQSS